MKRAKRQHILVEHYLDLYSRAVAILGDEDDAKDAVQEAIVKTLVRVGVRDPLSYCLRATANESINILRHKRRLTQLDETLLPNDYEEEGIVKMVNEGKEQLQPLERLVLEFHREEGYTLARLASLLGVSVSTIKRMLSNADKKMKQTISNHI